MTEAIVDDVAFEPVYSDVPTRSDSTPRDQSLNVGNEWLSVSKLSGYNTAESVTSSAWRLSGYDTAESVTSSGRSGTVVVDQSTSSLTSGSTLVDGNELPSNRAASCYACASLLCCPILALFALYYAGKSKIHNVQDWLARRPG